MQLLAEVAEDTRGVDLFEAVKNVPKREVWAT